WSDEARARVRPRCRRAHGLRVAPRRGRRGGADRRRRHRARALAARLRAAARRRRTREGHRPVGLDRAPARSRPDRRPRRADDDQRATDTDDDDGPAATRIPAAGPAAEVRRPPDGAPRAVPAGAGEAADPDRGRAAGGADHARRRKRAPAPGGHGRLLVQPLQRPRRQGRGEVVPDLLRARCHPPPRARQVRRPAARDGHPPGHALLSRQLAQRAPGLHGPGGGGHEDGERVLDLLLRHPSTATFIATKLVRRFVADEPPPALVERVAATFRRSDGDVKAMLRTILASPEFWAPEARGAKIKKPFEYVASAVRAVDGYVADARAGFLLVRSAAEMGEGLYGAQPPTGYPDRAEAWVNAGALLARMNFALALTQGRLP